MESKRGTELLSSSSPPPTSSPGGLAYLHGVVKGRNVVIGADGWAAPHSSPRTGRLTVSVPIHHRDGASLPAFHPPLESMDPGPGHYNLTTKAGYKYDYRHTGYHISNCIKE